MYLAYAQADADEVKSIVEKASSGRSDFGDFQHLLMESDEWPAAIGEAISQHAGFLLFWSASVSQSHFLEFQWKTAIALQCNIGVWLLDETPLPPLLANKMFLDKAGLVEWRPEPAEKKNGALGDKVLHRLKHIHATKPTQVAQRMDEFYDRHGLI